MSIFLDRSAGLGYSLYMMNETTRLAFQIENALVDFSTALDRAVDAVGGDTYALNHSFLLALLDQYAGKVARSITIQIAVDNVGGGQLSESDMIAVCAAHNRYVNAREDMRAIETAVTARLGF